MAENIGIWHRTTLQAVKERRPTYQTTARAGQKRPYDGVQTTEQASSTRTTEARWASGLNRQLPRLTASTVKMTNPVVERGGTQAAHMCATPTSTRDPLLLLSHPIYGLPRQLVDNMSSLGIKTIYPWQKECLLGPGLLNGEKSLVYSAPTGGGKSLVADVLMLKRILRDRDAKALLVLPFVALVQEKTRWLRGLVQAISRAQISGDNPGNDDKVWRRRADADTVRIVPFFGGSKIRATWHDFDIGVCTIEKVSPCQVDRMSDCRAENSLLSGQRTRERSY